MLCSLRSRKVKDIWIFAVAISTYLKRSVAALTIGIATIFVFYK